MMTITISVLVFLSFLATYVLWLSVKEHTDIMEQRIWRSLLTSLDTRGSRRSMEENIVNKINVDTGKINSA